MKRLGLLFVALCLAAASGGTGEPPPAVEIVERSEQAFYYAGDDMRAKVTMKLVTEGGESRTRVLTMLRKNQPGSSEQRFFLYFHEPGDVRRTAFLVWKYPDRDDDRWLIIPAINMVRRVAARDSRSSFVGSDFSYEDVSGRDIAADNHTLVREEKLGDRDCYVIESVPRAETDYTKRLRWVDRETFLPPREEYYDAKGELARQFTADEIAAIAGAGGKTYPTVVKRTMRNVKSGHQTEVSFTEVSYDLGLGDDVFTERSLQSPPQKWVR